jgi:hypothetical protein
MMSWGCSAYRAPKCVDTPLIAERYLIPALVKEEPPNACGGAQPHGAILADVNLGYLMLGAIGQYDAPAVALR